MRKQLILILVLTVVLVSMLAACAAPAPTPAPTPAPGKIGEIPAVPAGEVYEWTMFSLASAESNLSAGVFAKEIIPRINDVTNGRLKIDFLAPGEHPYKMADMLIATSERKCELAFAHYASMSGADARLGAPDLPFLQPSGGHSAKKDMHRLLDPLMAPLLAEWGVFELAHSYDPPQDIWHKTKYIEDLDSLKGERIRTWNPELDLVVEMLGGTPVRVDWAEVYTALQTGLVDGMITGVGGAVTAKLVEVVKYYQPIATFESSLEFICNTEAWNELPPEIQGAVMGVVDVTEGYLADYQIRAAPGLFQLAQKEYGLNVGVVSSELRDEMVALAYDGVWKPWSERAGPGSLEFLNAIIAQLENAGYKVPGVPR